MVSPSAKSMVLLLAGIGLLMNPVYYSPDNLDGSGAEFTYEAYPVENETLAERALFEFDQVLRCGTERACVLEEAVVAEGELEYNGTIQHRDRATSDPYSDRWNRYELVSHDGSYYAPETEYEDNVTVLSHERLSTMEALEHVAIPSNEASPEALEAVETGSVTLVSQQIAEFERGYPIEHDGEIYAGGVSSLSVDQTEVQSVRAMLFTLGAVLVFLGWYLRGRWAYLSTVDAAENPEERP